MGEKEQRTNEQYGLGLNQVQEGWFRGTSFLCIRRLTLTCFLREISTKPREMLIHLDWSSVTAPGPNLMPTGLFCCPLSTALLRPPSQLPSLSSFLQLLSDRSSIVHFRSRRDLELSPLFGFMPKQTKRSSAWRTPFIVSQLTLYLIPWNKTLLTFKLRTFAQQNCLK